MARGVRVSTLALLGMMTLAGAGTATAQTIVETAASSGQFNTLINAVRAAGLTDALNSPGPFTLFAPTDAAFAQLPPGTVEGLMQPENRQRLVALLSYHVVPGRVTSQDFVGRQTAARTALGPNVQINATGASVRVNDATVQRADMPASNGVIHMIDRVITPPRQ